MKKALFIQHWSTLGGSGVSLYYTCQELSKKYNVKVLLPNNPQDLSDYLLSKNIKFRTLDFSVGQISYYSGGPALYSFGFWRNLFKCIINLKSWEKIIEEEKPDIVFVNSKVLCYLSLVLKKYKSVCFVRETIPLKRNLIMDLITKSLLDKFTIVSFLSNYDLIQTKLTRATSVISHDFLVPEEYKVIENGNNPDNNLNIAYFGGNDHLKGFHMILKAAKILKSSPVKFLIIGYMNTTQSRLKRIVSFFDENTKINVNYEKYIEIHGLSNNIIIYGKQNDISTIMNNSDILAFPMTEPHQSRPAFEAGVFRKSVIMSGFDNIKEFFVDHENALLFEPNSVQSFVSSIEFCLSNPQIVKSLGESNYLKTIRNHNASTSLSKLIVELEKNDENVF